MRPTRLLEPKLHIPMNKLYLAPSHISPPRHLATPHLTSYLYPYFKFSGLFHTHLVPSALRPLAACTLFYHLSQAVIVNTFTGVLDIKDTDKI